MENPNNRMVAAGRLDGPLELSHEVMNEPFYAGTLLVKRLSGAIDRLPVTIPGKLLSGEEWPPETLLQMQGQVRSYNKMVEGAGRLMVTLFAQHVAVGAENDTLNRVELSGALCKPPVYRSTPFGREICDLMLAVPRRYGRADYLPVIAWGQLALRASRLQVGDPLALEGRVQSRLYHKVTEAGTEERTAYEVSMMHLLESPSQPEP